jgi:hypothetical protein
MDYVFWGISSFIRLWRKELEGDSSLRIFLELLLSPFRRPQPHILLVHSAEDYFRLNLYERQELHLDQRLEELNILRLKRDGTRAETRFGLSAKRTSPFISAGASVQSTTGSRVVRLNVSNAGYTKFRGSVKHKLVTGFPLHSPVSPSHPLSCITVCHHVSPGLYNSRRRMGSLWDFYPSHP